MKRPILDLNPKDPLNYKEYLYKIIGIMSIQFFAPGIEREEIKRLAFQKQLISIEKSLKKVKLYDTIKL